MKFRSETQVADNGALVELGTVTHEGKDFAALGAVVDHERGYVFGYVVGKTLTTWEGKAIGSLRLVSSWRVRSRDGGSHKIYAYRAFVDGRHYHGRGLGENACLALYASSRRGGT